MLIDWIDFQTANVYGIYGHLGGGKTLSAVEIMYFFLKYGHKVVTNIRLFGCPNMHNYTYIDDINSIDPWELPTGAPRGTRDKRRVAIVIDECAEFFDQFSSTSPVLKRFMSWLRHSSKRGQHVFLIVQKPEYLAKSLRLIINKWIVCDDLQQFRVPVFKIKLPFMGRFVRRLVADRNGEIISRGLNLGNKYIFGRYYDTSQSIATEGRRIDESKPLPRPSAVSFIWALCCLIYVVFVFYFS